MEEAPRIMKMVDVASFTGIPLRTLYDMLGSDRMPPPLEGWKPRRWSREAIEAWVKQ